MPTYPCEALALEVACDLGNVVLNHLSKLGLVGNALDPSRELRVPDEGVATEHLAVLSGESGSLVGGVESELATGSLESIPLHAVEMVSNRVTFLSFHHSFQIHTCSPA
jgi:hypothetical protein